MSLITLELPEETKRDLQRLSMRSGKDVPAVIAELVDDALLSEELDDVFAANTLDADQERASAAAGIQRGLDDYAAGRHRSFDAFAAEIRKKHSSLMRTTMRLRRPC